jgi:hypothetical protein
MNFASGSYARRAQLLDNRLGPLRHEHRIINVTTANTNSQILKCANNVPRPSTVPKSVMKHAARIILPIDVSLKPPSIITAHTTATDVVESATPAICACCMAQPKANCATSQTTANGRANETTPVSTLTRQFALSKCGSISVPIRNVSTPLRSNSRKLVHSVDDAACVPPLRNNGLRWINGRPYPQPYYTREGRESNVATPSDFIPLHPLLSGFCLFCSLHSNHKNLVRNEHAGDFRRLDDRFLCKETPSSTGFRGQSRNRSLR